MANGGRGMDAGITAIIPVFNGAAFIGNALQSIVDQTLQVDQVIVVDDCSADETVSVVEHWRERDNRITLIKNAVNSGPAHSRNEALRNCKTPFAAFLDADDRWLPRHAELVSEAFRLFPAASVAYTQVRDKSAEPSAAVRRGPAVLPNALNRLIGINPIPQSAAAVRVESVLEIDGYAPGARYAEDYDLWVRLACAGAVFVESLEATLDRGEHPEQVSGRFSERMIDSAWAVRKRATEAKFGGIEHADPQFVAGLVEARTFDFSVALYHRRRDLVDRVGALTAWVPTSDTDITLAEKLTGWRWPVWRTAALAYDRMPPAFRDWWRM